VVDRIGQQLGNYRLIRLLGRGGFGEVYLGEHIHLGIQVAIKVLHDQMTGNEMVQFPNEAQAVARLRHPHIVSILDFGVEGETAFLIMEYAPNGTLLERHRRGTRLPLTIIVPYVKQIADALQYAHQQRVIHLDIKPENMLLGQHYEVLLSDFGMNTVRTVRNGEDTFQQAIGTGAYMAPEQIHGEPHPQSDQYALGIVVYEWITGTWPFQGETPIDIVIKHLNAPPPPLRTHIPTISPDVEQVVLTALAKDPKQRFGNVRAFATALEQASQSTIMAPLSERKPESIHIFFSYARRDQNLRDQLENHLSNLKYRGLITTWHAREISTGEETIQQIDIHLNTAHVILLLISADFLASEYCYSREMARALHRHERGEAHVIPVLLRPVLFTDAPFAKLQPLPTNGKPVANWRNRDSAFVDIALGIERVVQKRLASASPVPSAEIVLPARIPTGFPGTPLPPIVIAPSGPIATGFPGAPLPSPPSLVVPSRSRRGLILVGLSLLGLFSAGILLVQHPNFIPFVGVIVGSLILFAGIISAIRALVKRAQSRASRRQEQEEPQRRQLEEGRRQEQEEARLRELEEARRSEQERAYYEKALAAYEHALRQNNADATAYRGKGNALVGLERYDEALTAFEQAGVLTPLPTAYVSMGNVLVTLGRCDEAVAAYEQALALDAMYASAYAGMSKALLQLGRTQEAEQAHEQAKQLGEDD
jgi:serine/threonine protein kinase/Flp pilus assembly protein TadD